MIYTTLTQEQTAEINAVEQDIDPFDFERDDARSIMLAYSNILAGYKVGVSVSVRDSVLPEMRDKYGDRYEKLFDSLKIKDVKKIILAQDRMLKYRQREADGKQPVLPDSALLTLENMRDRYGVAYADLFGMESPFGRTGRLGDASPIVAHS